MRFPSISRFLSAALLTMPAVLTALEIPVRKGDGKAKPGAVIAFVDMDRIYQEFPETRKARQEYEVQAQKIKKTLTDEAAELDDLREQLAVLKAASEAPAVSTRTAVIPSTAAVAAPTLGGESLAQKEQLLADQEAQLAADRKDAAQALSDYEKKRAEQIFGKLYKALVQLAEEKGVDIILDKQGLLFGQGGMDLTEALSRRVRGLPDQEAP